MRTDTSAFEEVNKSSAKEPRYTIEVAFDAANTDLYYFTSHDASAVPGGSPITAQVEYGCIQRISSTSQTLAPEKAQSTIGTINFNLVDLSTNVTNQLYTKLQFGKGLRGM